MQRTRKHGSKGLQVQLNLNSLHGVSWKADKDTENVRRPRIMAVVAFTGSATKMEVSSSTLCSRTGHLIESSPLRVDSRVQQEQPDRHCPLFATFLRPQDHDTRNNRSTSTSCSASSYQPHVKIELPDRESQSPAASFGRSNRGCRITRHQDGQDSDSTVPSDDVEKLGLEQITSALSSTSLQWSSDAMETVMPEILEMHISVRSDDNRILQEGIAHVVLFGNKDDCGTSTVDVPIKRHSSVHPSETNAGLVFEDDAFVRLQVQIDTCGDDPASHSRRFSASSSSHFGRQEEEQHHRHEDPIRLWRVEEKQRLNEEEMAEARVKAADLTFQEADAKKNIACGAFDVLQAFVEMFKCNEKSERDDDYGAPSIMEAATMESTIATRESLDI